MTVWYVIYSRFLEYRDFTEFSNFLLRKMDIKIGPGVHGLVPRLVITWLPNHLDYRKLVTYGLSKKCQIWSSDIFLKILVNR